MRYFTQNIKRIKPVKYIFLALFIVNSLEGIAQTYNVEYAFTIIDYYTQSGNPSDYLCSVYFETMNGGKLHSILSEASHLTHSKGGTLNIPDVDGAPTDFIISYSNGGEFSAFNTFGVIFTKKSFFSNNNCGEIYFNYNNSSLPYYCSASYTFYPDLSNILTNPVDNALPLDNPIQMSMKPNSFPTDVFHWEFSVDGGTTWLSSSTVGSFLSAKTLFGTKLNVTDYINQNVLLRLNPWGDPTKTKGCSKIVYTYQIKASPPHITNITPTCPASLGGDISITIDRPLDIDETLHLELKEKDYPNSPTNLTIEHDKIAKDVPHLCGYNMTSGKTYYITYYTTFTKGGFSTPLTTSDFTIPYPVTFTATPTSSSCNGDGTITLSDIDGGSRSGYQYFDPKTSAWKSLLNVPLPQITGLSAGDYNLRVKDSNGCESQPKTVTVRQIVPVTASITSTPALCKGDNGSITLNASEGKGSGYQYSYFPYTTWTGFIDDKSTQILSLPAGKYYLKVKDGNGCIAKEADNVTDKIFSADITEPTTVVNAYIVSTANISCHNKDNGTITLQASGGTEGNYQYSYAPYETWTSFNNGKNTQITDLPAGNYTLKVKDKNGCIAKKTDNSTEDILSASISNPPAISITGTVTDVPCADGVSRGAITVNATGGTGTLSYSWAGRSETINAISNLTAKDYTVTVTDANGCNATQTFIVQQPLSLPSVSFTSTANPTSFGGSDGSLAISSSGGTGAYTYTWTKDDNPLPLPSLTSLSAGSYNVTITDVNGCQSSPATATLTNPVPPIILSNTKTNVTCYCGNNGDITVSVSRDPLFTQPITYTYQWYKDDILLTQFTTNKGTKLTAGKYKIVVKDNYNASSSIITDLTEIYHQIIPTLKITNVSCFGKGDGKAEVTGISGGTGSYTCEWRNNADKHVEDGLVANNLSPGSYYVIITDDAGCIAKSSPVNVTQHDPLTVTLTGHDPDGYGRGNGSITAEVKGGNGGNEYVWTGTNFEGTEFTSTETSVSGLKAGNYSLTVTDKNLCSATASVHIDQPNPLIVNMEVIHPVSCHNGSDGTLKATATGGVKLAGDTYTYTWKKINANNTYSPISSGTSDCLSVSGSAGDYMVEVEDAYHNELKSGNTITLINPPTLAISTQSITEVKCYDDYTGEIHFTVTGGAGSYTYLNDKGETISNDLTGLHAGKYTVKIKDAYCELDHEFTVSEPSAPLSVTLAKKELSAYHAADAELVATVSGGTFSPDKSCSFDWTGSDSKTKTASGLASGTYQLTVTDNNGCTVQASTIFIDPLKVDIVVKDSISCYGEKGELAARVVGGEPSLTGLPYKYIWYKHDVKTGTSTLLYPLADSNQSNDSLATDLPEGYYSVKIDDNHGRIVQTEPFHLTQPELVQISVDSTNVSCKGDNNGSIRVAATGGNGGYTYLWEDGSTQNERTSLSPGKYTIQVFDRKNCTSVPASQTITITEPDKLTLSLQKRDVLVACDGKIEAIASGGIRPYRFRWNDAEETTDSVETQLCDGNYKVEVIDKNQCTATAYILLPPPLVLKISVQDSVNCFGDNNGSLLVHAQGGVPYKIGKPYRYCWKKQNKVGIYEELTVEKDSIVVGLTTGWYALNITDSIGVTLRADSVFYLPEPEPLAIRIQKTDVLCHGASTGAISAVVTGGLKPYTLLWNTGSTGTELQNIPAGTYTITATDRHGCTKQYTATIEQPDSLMIGFTNIIAPTTSTSCNGSLTASVSGGVRPYTYQWSDTNANTATADHLCYGTFYTVTVTDSVGCSAQVTKTSKFAPPPFVVSLSVEDSIQCHGTSAGAIAARVSGGIPFTSGKPYTYIWKKKNSAGEYRSMANSNDSIIKNLTSGWYAFNVQDAELNTTTESVYFYLPEPDMLALTVNHTDISCKDLHNGNASVRVSGGIAPYSYKWSNGETSPAIENLVPGEYSIEVTDKHGCISRQSVTVTEPELLSVTLQPKLISEHNVCNGSLKAVVTGGTAPFSYAWSGVNSTADAASSLCAADYSVTVTDAHDCSANQKITLSNPPALRLSLAIQDSIKCNGNVQGVLTATAQGGIPFTFGKKYRYTWKKKNSRGIFETMPAYTDSIASDLPTGMYACNITDANGISLHQDSLILLPEPTELQLAIQQTNIGCTGADEGSATVTPSGGSLPYSYAWSTGDKTATVRNLSAGSYIVRVTDRNGCVAAHQIYISKATPLYLFLYKKQPLCYQSCDGEIKTTVSGGIAPYSFRWTGSASTGSEAGSLCAGKYSLLVTDAAGCTIQKNDSLQNPAQLVLDLGANRYICSGQTIRYNISIPSKTGITYNWSGPNGFTSASAIVDLTEAGTYTASVTDVLGCNNTGTVTLTPSGTTVENEFALPTQAFASEQIVVVNTTYPASDSIKWILPEKAQIKSVGQSYAEFVLPETGSYVIKMISYKGVCSSVQEKVMIVSERSNLNDIESAKTPFIQSFCATPNPSHGNFATKIVLRDKADVQLKLINILSNTTVFQGRQSGDSVYEIPINVSTLSGTYLLLLETPKGSATLKVIIFKP
jgi:hypothetical protein